MNKRFFSIPELIEENCGIRSLVAQPIRDARGSARGVENVEIKILEIPFGLSTHGTEEIAILWHLLESFGCKPYTRQRRLRNCVAACAALNVDYSNSVGSFRHPRLTSFTALRFASIARAMLKPAYESYG
jgi:hypothetical protein